jgi:hypothetical protein
MLYQLSPVQDASRSLRVLKTAPSWASTGGSRAGVQVTLA